MPPSILASSTCAKLVCPGTVLVNLKLSSYRTLDTNASSGVLDEIGGVASWCDILVTPRSDPDNSCAS
jgi:hypothetical protein